MGVKQYQTDNTTNKDHKMAHKYETLRTLFEKTDAFNENGLTLFQQLRELVWSKLENYSTQNEILLINRYDSMIKELEILIRT
mgnify:CR=1 FL=1